MNTTNHQDILTFARIFDVATAWKDDFSVNQDVIDLRVKLIHEEVVNELLPCLEKFKRFPSLENLTEVADGLVDSIYVLLGAVVALDLPWDQLWEEVHRSNMAKVHDDGSIRRRDDGKILKPEGWKPPDLFSIVMRWQTERVIAYHEELQQQYKISDIRTGEVLPDASKFP